MMLRGTIAFSVLAIGFARPALACKCDHPRDVEEARARADVVFQGRALGRVAAIGSYGPDIPGWQCLFVVEKQWKGRPLPVQRVFSSYSSCGLAFARNVSYLVFASARDGLESERCDSLGSAAHQVVPNDPIVAALGPPTFEAQLPATVPSNDSIAVTWPEGPPVLSREDERWPRGHWHPLLLIVAAVLLTYPAIREAYKQDRGAARRRVR